MNIKNELCLTNNIDNLDINHIYKNINNLKSIIKTNISNYNLKSIHKNNNNIENAYTQLKKGLIDIINIRTLNSKIVDQVEEITKSFLKAKKASDQNNLTKENILYQLKQLEFEIEKNKKLETEELKKLGYDLNNKTYNLIDLKQILLQELENRKSLKKEIEELEKTIENNNVNLNNKIDIIRSIPGKLDKLKSDLFENSNIHKESKLI